MKQKKILSLPLKLSLKKNNLGVGKHYKKTCL
jgi:hypothetical protein